MPWPSIDPGDLRHLITIQQYGPVSPTAYDAGGVQMAWTKFTTAYASSKPMVAKDVIREGQTGTQTDIPLTIRYQPGILPNMRVVFTDTQSTFVIRGIVNHGDRNVLLSLMCVALGANE